MEINPKELKVYKDDAGEVLNPRGPRFPISALCEQIEAAGGILEPLVVRQEEDGVYVISGHRRLAAALRLGMPTVPIAYDETALEAVEAMLVANTGEGVPVIVLDKDDRVIGGLARAVHALHAAGKTRLSLATDLGMTQDNVSALIALVDAPPDIRRRVASGQMSLSAYARIKYAPVEELTDLLAGDEPITMARAVRAVKQIRKQSSDEPPPAIKAQDMDEAAEGPNFDVTAVLREIVEALELLSPDQIGFEERVLLARITDLAQAL